jgi:hypothetical protein
VDKSFLNLLFEPKVRSPVLVQGLPGFGNVGKIAVHLLIKFTGARLFAEFYSPFFPDYVTVDSNGVCYPPRYQFYEASLEKTDFVILTGDTQPALDDVVAHYIVCGEILDFLSELDCNFVVTLGGVPSVQPSREIYVAASSSRLAVEFMERGAIIYGKGRILGAAGLMLGLAKERGWDGVSLLGATTGLQADKGAGFALFKFLVKTFGGEVKEGL